MGNKHWRAPRVQSNSDSRTLSEPVISTEFQKPIFSLRVKNDLFSFVLLMASLLRQWRRDTRLPCYPKVRHSYEPFHKWKWRKAKKQLLLIYMETFLSILRPKIQCMHSVFISSTMIKMLIMSSFRLIVTPFQALRLF